MTVGALLLWGPRTRLPLQVKHVADESTGSFVSRLAHRNGLELGDFLERVGYGRRAVDPRLTEMYVNAAGLSHLAVLTGRQPHQLQRALPSLAQDLLLPGEERARWEWLWEPPEGEAYIVRGCDLCARRRLVEEPVWLLRPDRWHVCAQHGRWTDSSRSDAPARILLAALPAVAQAHGVRLRLERRFPQAGAGLFADAFQIAVHWWTRHEDVLRWTVRAQRAGLPPRDLRAAPLVVYPEAVALLGGLLRYEQQARCGAAARGELVRLVQSWAAVWELDEGRAVQPVLEWLLRHQVPAATPGPGGGRALSLPPGHLRAAAGSGSLEQLSCLPWQLGFTPGEL